MQGHRRSVSGTTPATVRASAACGHRGQLRLPCSSCSGSGRLTCACVCNLQLLPVIVRQSASGRCARLVGPSYLPNPKHRAVRGDFLLLLWWRALQTYTMYQCIPAVLVGAFKGWDACYVSPALVFLVFMEGHAPKSILAANRHGLSRIIPSR